jgi:hypothetical protein
MTTLAPLDDRIVKQGNQVFPNLFGEEGGDVSANTVNCINLNAVDVSANTVNCINLNSVFVNCDQIERQTAGDLQINNDTLLVGDLTLDGTLDLVETAGQLRLSNVITTPTAGGNAGHLQIEINGVLRKIALLNV